MSNNFEIFNLDFSDYGFLIINKDFNSLGEKIFDINKALLQKKYVGNVIFNTLTSTCNKNKQYSKVYFDGSEIQLNTLKPLHKVDKKIQSLVSNYFNVNSYLLDNLLFWIM